MALTEEEYRRLLGDRYDKLGGNGTMSARVAAQSGDPVRQGAFDQSDAIIRMLQMLGDRSFNAPPLDLSVTEEDLALSRQAFDATRQQAELMAQQGAGNIARSVTGEFAQRGLSGSTFEAAQAGIGQKALQNQLMQMLNQTRGEQSRALMELPFQRAQADTNRNQMLFDTIIRSSMPALDWRRQQLGVGAEYRKPSAGEIIGGAVGNFANAAGTAAGAKWG